ncbi:hypothetical protein [Streptomyces sp. SS]|uniref:hypothetical protein n=1 Tax=Streptomyces sp. SS TaxID=260742 RepID=UPI0002E71A74|nr:hypothetical protein [Streptomyces sp. SS]
MNAASLVHSGIPPEDAAAITEAWNGLYPAIRSELNQRVKSATAFGADPTRLRDLRRELGQLDRCTHRACTQSPPGFSPHAALRRIQDVIRLLPDDLAGDAHRLAALLADRALVQRTLATAERYANTDRTGESR